MIEELSEKIWNNPRFRAAAASIELAWVNNAVGNHEASRPDLEIADKAMQAAAVLSCSSVADHRFAAYRVATSTFELYGAATLPFDQALRVVLTRLGNFPALRTNELVSKAGPDLPWSFHAEELRFSDANTVNVGSRKITLTSFQHRLWGHLSSGDRVAISAPTSAGKSFVLQAYLASLFQRGGDLKVVYIVPTRALIAQVANDLTEEIRSLGQAAPQIVTVPEEPEAVLPTRAIFVMTQERLQIVLGAHPEFSASLIVVDEAHSIADGGRGILLQWVVDELLLRNPLSQVLFASPQVGNLEIFGSLFGLDDAVVLPSGEPTVAQNFIVVEVLTARGGEIALKGVTPGRDEHADLGRRKLGQTLATRTERLVHLPALFGKKSTNIIYANGAAEAEKIAMLLADLLSDRPSSPERDALAQLASETVHRDYVLASCVKRGIAFHYSNMPTALRQAVERAFSDGVIDFLACTSTLLQGVNLPAKNIFMCAPEKGRGQALGGTDFWNLAGRAGRLLREFQGNIYLIDYGNWARQPLGEPKAEVITSSIEKTLTTDWQALLSVIQEADVGVRRKNDPDTESAFVRLLSDQREGRLATTLRRSGVEAGSPVALGLQLSLEQASTALTLPNSVIRQASTISAHKQERLFNRLRATIKEGGEIAARGLVPLHPREAGAYGSYSRILEICHEIILGLDTTRGLHRFQALMARRWMLGMPLPEIIQLEINRAPRVNRRTTIRETLGTIERTVRFETVRLFSCYSTILDHSLREASLEKLVSSIPPIAVYLEVGASDRTMISLVSLGLSRAAAKILNEASSRKDLDTAAAKEWLSSRPVESLGLSPLMEQEVRALLA